MVPCSPRPVDVLGSSVGWYRAPAPSFTVLTAMLARSRSLKNLVRLLDESAPNVFTVVGLLAVENSPF